MDIKKLEACVDEMQQIVDWSITHQSHLGYFALLYQAVTVRINRDIHHGLFEHNEQMTKLVEDFAGRYLFAANQFIKNKHCETQTWKTSFNLPNPNDISLLQHLVLGMNAHIVFDLAVSTAKIYPKEHIFDVKNDFFRINEVLISMIDDFQNMIAQVFPLMKVMDFLMGRMDEKIAGNVIILARNKAWDLARLIALSDENYHHKILEEMDKEANEIALDVLKPMGKLRLLCAISVSFEKGTIPYKLKKMQTYQKRLVTEFSKS